jgi:hypothetical protein
MFAIQHQPTPGACFHDAFLIGVELLDCLDRELICVVHGVATGTGGAALDWRYGHAWLEIELGGVTLVIDHTRPNQPLPRELYYRAGRIDPAECRRYSLDEAIGHALRTGHSGPWEPFPDDVPPAAKKAKRGPRSGRAKGGEP